MHYLSSLYIHLLVQEYGFFRMPMETEIAYYRRLNDFVHDVAEKNGFKGDLAALNNCKGPMSRFAILKEKVEKVEKASRIL